MIYCPFAWCLSIGWMLFVNWQASTNMVCSYKHWEEVLNNTDRLDRREMREIKRGIRCGKLLFLVYKSRHKIRFYFIIFTRVKFNYWHWAKMKNKFICWSLCLIEPSRPSSQRMSAELCLKVHQHEKQTPSSIEILDTTIVCMYLHEVAVDLFC